jgi:predicted transcriptional regulator
MEKRDYQLTVGFSDELRRFIEQCARSEDQTKAAVVRRCVAQAARLVQHEGQRAA